MIGSFFAKYAVKKVISKLVKDNPKQLTFNEYNYIVKTVIAKNGCNMLVFGVGQDSNLWLISNRKGETFFLENSISWFAQIRTENPKINGFLTSYKTLRKNLKELLENPSLDLMLALPDEINTKNWDVVFVDGQKGSNDIAPGRMQSIYNTSVLSAKSKNIDVFVHDCVREVEKAYLRSFLP